MAASVEERFSWVLDDYGEEFGLENITIIGLDDELMEKAIDVLNQALDDNKELTDEELRVAIGLPPTVPDDITI